jgi:hypothetical protein
MVFLLMCGSDDSGGGGAGGGSDGGPSSSSGGSSSGSSGNTDAGGPTATAEPFTPKGRDKQGAVNVFIRPDMPGGQPKLAVAGYFLDYSTSNGAVPDGYSRGGARATSCTKRSAGACEAVKCTLTPDASFAFAPPLYVSAGDISVTRSSGGGPLVITPSAQPDYQGSADDPPAVTAGETVSIAAAGADVPAFTESVAFLTSPKPTVQELFATNADVEVTWSGGAGAGKVLIGGENGSVESGSVATLTCRFDIAANKGTIPIAVLEDLRGMRFDLNMSPDSTKKDVGGFEVRLHAETSADLPSSNGFALVVGQ